MKIRCAIIDDEPLAVSLLKSYVEKTPFLELACTFNSAVAAMEELKANPVDLLFLDIQMPELNGVDFSKMVSKDTKVVFTTAYDKYAIDSYKVNALDYLLKPISYAEFLRAASKAEEWFDMKNVSTENPQKNAESIFVRTEYKLVQIELKKILYIEGLKDYVKIYVENETHPVLSLMSIKSLEEMLPADMFIRVHRSFIVNPYKIKMIERNRIVFGKEYIPISETYKQSFVDFLARYSILPKGF